MPKIYQCFNLSNNITGMKDDLPPLSKISLTNFRLCNYSNKKTTREILKGGDQILVQLLLEYSKI